jgi:hypothetical protein
MYKDAYIHTKVFVLQQCNTKSKGILMSESSITLNPEAARKLADALMRRRIELGIRSARQMGNESGLDYRTITGIEACRRSNISRNTLAVLELQLQWPAGYLNALVSAASEPTPETTELDIPKGSDVEHIETARAIAQATFNQTLRTLAAQ